MCVINGVLFCLILGCLKMQKLCQSAEILCCPHIFLIKVNIFDKLEMLRPFPMAFRGELFVVDDAHFTGLTIE